MDILTIPGMCPLYTLIEAKGMDINMKIRSRYEILIILIVAGIAVFYISYHQLTKHSDYSTANENIILTKGFNVNSESTDMNTAVKGTIFMKGSDGLPEHIQIVACMEIDPDDWGGVAIYIPDNWYISGIKSSYPEGKDPSIVAKYVSVWTTKDPMYELNKLIEIGRDRSYKPTGGGTGIVVIDLYPDNNRARQLKTFRIMVGVGSGERDGVKISEPDSEFIEIPIP